jgi:UDP-glucose 4-epimerase
MSEKIVVTGGAGFIGSHIVEEAVSRGLEVVVFDSLATGYMHNIQPFMDQGNVTFVEGDIMNLEHLTDVCAGANSVFHLAAKISVPESMDKKTEYVTVNASGSLNVLEACKQAGVKNVVLSSSAAIYGDNPTVPKLETMLPEPKSPYAVTKLDGEYYFKMYRDEYGLNATSLRYFNVFGPRQDPQSQYAAAVPIFIDKAVKGEDITVFGDGEQTRDFIFVKDIVQGNYLAAGFGDKASSGGPYNVAWGQKITINELATLIIKITGSSAKVLHLDERAGDIRHSMADNQKIVSELGFKASSTLEQGLSATVEFFANKH